MYQFKAMVVCEDCGEIHAEKWLESSNRHATTTTLFMLCDSCLMNELTPVDEYLGLTATGVTEDDDVEPVEFEDCPYCGTTVNINDEDVDFYSSRGSHAHVECHIEHSINAGHDICTCRICMDKVRNHNDLPF